MANQQHSPLGNHFISRKVAMEMTERFKTMREKILLPVHLGKDILPFSESFDKAAIQALINQPGCVRFRSYLGMNENLEVRFIFVGVNEKGDDMLSASETDDFLLVEEGQRCPPDCPPPPPGD